MNPMVGLQGPQTMPQNPNRAAIAGLMGGQGAFGIPRQEVPQTAPGQMRLPPSLNFGQPQPGMQPMPVNNPYMRPVTR